MPDAVTIELPEIAPRPPVTPPLGEELRAFERLLPQLLTTHRGQYVAVLDGRVVGSGPELLTVLSRAYAEHGYRPILCRLVTDQPRRVVRWPSVRRAGG